MILCYDPKHSAWFRSLRHPSKPHHKDTTNATPKYTKTCLQTPLAYSNAKQRSTQNHKKRLLTQQKVPTSTNDLQGTSAQFLSTQQQSIPINKNNKDMGTHCNGTQSSPDTHTQAVKPTHFNIQYTPLETQLIESYFTPFEKVTDQNTTPSKMLISFQLARACFALATIGHTLHTWVIRVHTLHNPRKTQYLKSPPQHQILKLWTTLWLSVAGSIFTAFIFLTLLHQTYQNTPPQTTLEEYRTLLKSYIPPNPEIHSTLAALYSFGTWCCENTRNTLLPAIYILLHLATVTQMSHFICITITNLQNPKHHINIKPKHSKKQRTRVETHHQTRYNWPTQCLLFVLGPYPPQIWALLLGPKLTRHPKPKRAPTKKHYTRHGPDRGPERPLGHPERPVTTTPDQRCKYCCKTNHPSDNCFKHEP